jgi:hypothetical protein
MASESRRSSYVIRSGERGLPFIIRKQLDGEEWKRKGNYGQLKAKK